MRDYDPSAHSPSRYSSPPVRSLTQGSAAGLYPVAMEVFSSPPGQITDYQSVQYRIVTNLSTKSLPILIDVKDRSCAGSSCGPVDVRLGAFETMAVTPMSISDWSWRSTAELLVIGLPAEVFDSVETDIVGRTLSIGGDGQIHRLGRLAGSGLAQTLAESIKAAQSSHEPVLAHLIDAFVASLKLAYKSGVSMEARIEAALDTGKGPLDRLDGTQFEGLKPLFADAHLRALKVCDLAQASDRSGPSFSRAFKNETGYTPGEAIREQRLFRAKALLRRSSLSLAHVAQECGFYDQAHMARSFKTGLGLSPKRYRKNAGIQEELT